MVNRTLFSSLLTRLFPASDAVNEAGGSAYRFTDEHALAQLAVTGCLNQTYYADAGAQLSAVRSLVAKVTPEFVGKTAIYARERGSMKDMPALLLAALASPSSNGAAGSVLEQVFFRVANDGRMIRSFVQILRSGAMGRRSLGSRPKRLVRRYLESAAPEVLFFAAIGNTPSLSDVIKMVHPRPADATRAALFGYLVDRDHDEAALPEIVREYEEFKRGASKVPDVPFRYLTNLKLSTATWTAIARNASWTTVRMNLNTFLRHGVLANESVVRELAAKLRDGREIRRARALPYQILVALRNVDRGVPAELRSALHDALEIATANVPAMTKKIAVAIDVSGSMASPLTGVRKGATSQVRCVDAAALFAASIVRKNPSASVVAFSTEARRVALEPKDTIATNTTRISSLLGGGTSVSSALGLLNAEREAPDLVVIFSDNQSWVDTRTSGATALLEEWSRLKRANRSARLVLVDLQPYTTTQALDRVDVMNVGGFSDSVFTVIAEFGSGRVDGLVKRIEAVDLDRKVSPSTVNVEVKNE